MVSVMPTKAKSFSARSAPSTASCGESANWSRAVSADIEASEAAHIEIVDVVADRPVAGFEEGEEVGLVREADGLVACGGGKGVRIDAAPVVIE